MPATAAGEGMTGSPPPGLPTAGTPGTDERHTPHPLHPPEPQQPPSPLSTSCADRRRPQGPAAATRSGSARALTPTPISTCTQPAGEDQKTVSTPLDRPRSFRDDLWADYWRARHAHGAVIIVRFADDFIVGFEHEQDAQRFLSDLRDRFARFGLELHPDKTR